jgi:hypothetical protein
MPDVRAMVERLGGMAQKRQLVGLGARDLDLTRAVRSGDVHRVRNGWYSVLDPLSPAVQAVRVGGRLTGISAIEPLDGWTATTTLLHVSVSGNAARLRDRWNRHRRLHPSNTRGVVLHWEAPELAARGTATSVALTDAVTRVILDEPEEDALAVIAWLEHAGRFDDVDRSNVLGTLPASRKYLLRRPESGAESRPESLAHTRLVRLGHRIRTQVPVGDFDGYDVIPRTPNGSTS